MRSKAAPGTNNVRQSPAREWSLKRIQTDSALIKRIQCYRTPLRDRIMMWVAVLGDEPAYTVGLPILAWCSAGEVTLLVMMAWCFTFYLGHSLKDLFQLPRPFQVDRDVVCLEHHFSAEFGLPSTHTQAVCAIPFTLLFASPQLSYWWGWALFAVLYASSVAFSRLYLGVHSLLDVVAGAALGLLTCAAVLLWGPLLGTALLSLSIPVSLFLSFFFHLLLLLLYPRLPGLSTTFRDTCSILGVSVGALWALRLRSLFPFLLSPPSALYLWFPRLLLGISLLLAAHELSKRLLALLLAPVFSRYPPPLSAHMSYLAALKFLSYIGIGFNAIGLCPLLFAALGI